MSDETIEIVRIPDAVLDFGNDPEERSLSASATSFSASLEDWTTYRHRLDESVRYEARRTDDGTYEVKHPAAPESEAWTMDAESFEAVYKEMSEEEDA